MKKIIKLVICGILLSILLLTAFACDKKEEGEEETHPLKIAVMSDLHVMTEEEVGDPSYASYQEYAKKCQTMLYLSEALLKSAVDELIVNKPDVVLLSGDLSQNGSKKSLELVASQCKKLETAGIKVYVVDGVSDFKKEAKYFTASGTEEGESIEISDFSVMFRDYGFGEAISRHEGTYSYVVDINENYRLLVLEAASGYDYTDYDTDLIIDRTPETTDSLMEYIESSLEQARTDKKEMLVMSYFPINDSVGDYIGGMTKQYIVSIDRHEDVEYMLTEYGVRYIFSGHMHTQNMLTVSNEWGDLYDYTTGSLSCYPLPIRYFTETEDGFQEETVNLSAIKEEYIPSYISADEKADLMDSLIDYAKQKTYDQFFRKVESLVDYDDFEDGVFFRLLRSLWYFSSIQEAMEDETAQAFAACWHTVYEEFFAMPLYGENSVESRCITHGRTMPASPYSTVAEFFGESMCDIYSGDIHITGGSDEALVLRFIIYSGVELLAEQDLGRFFAELDENVDYFDLTDTVAHVFETDILDLNDQQIVNFLTIFTPVAKKINKSLRVKFSSPKALVDAFDTFFPMLVQLAAEYNEKDETIWGLRYSKYIKENGIIKIGLLIDDILIDIIAKDILY